MLCLHDHLCIFFTYSGNWLLWLSLNTWGQPLANVLESRRFGQIKLVSNLLRITPLSVNFAMLQTSPKFKITIYHCWWSASWLGGSADLGQTWLIFAGFLYICSHLVGWWVLASWDSLALVSGFAQLMSGRNKNNWTILSSSSSFA